MPLRLPPAFGTSLVGFWSKGELMLTVLAPPPEPPWDEPLPVEVKKLPADLAALDVVLSDPGLLWALVDRWREEFEHGRTRGLPLRAALSRSSR